MFTKKKVLNINGLLTLSAIHKHQSKRKAALAMGISVDTINRYVSGLEASLGTKLVHNGHNGCVLTPRAEHIVKIVEDAQSLLEAIYTENANGREDCDGCVKIMVPLSVSSNLFPYDWDDFYATYPNIKIISYCQLSRDCTFDEDSDLAIFVRKPENDNTITLLFEKDIACGLFASPGYLNKYGYPQNLSELCSRHRIVNLIGSEDMVNGWNEIVYQSQHICFQSNSTFSLLQAIRNGIGIGLMPMRFKDEGFICIENIPCVSKLTFYLVVNKKTQNLPKVKVVAEYYKSLISRM